MELLVAAAKLGAILCPVNWRQSPDELAFVIDDIDALLIVCDPRGLEDTLKAARTSSRATRARWVEAAGEDGEYEALLASGSAVDLDLVVDAGSPLLAIYTAAHDGHPSAALLSHSALLNQAVWLAYMYDLDASDTFLCAGPMFHLGVYLFILPLFVLGGTTVIATRADAETICRLTVQERCTVAFPLMQYLIDEITELNRDARYDLSSLRTSSHSPGWDAMVTLDHSRAARGSRWGQSETTGGVTWYGVGQDSQSRFGRSSPFVLVRVVDETGAELPVGEVGELVVRGTVVANGYWNREELNAETFGDGWRHTSDIGKREADGSITFIGPKGNMIKSGVENIYPVEVERVLRSHPSVADAAVIGVPDEKWIQSLKAIVVPASGCSPTQDELIVHCKQKLASYKKPRSVEFTESLPRHDGRIDYDELNRRHGGGGYPGGSTRSY
jgi:long-chain acyl-CoA synthetase